MPNTREKLIELCGDLMELPCCDTYEGMADHLIANDVTIQKHARWVYVGTSDGKKIYTCTNCECLISGQGDYCKCCGAKMDLPKQTKGDMNDG